jgi:hypothetical protein
MKKLNEEGVVYSEAHAKELLNVRANYNKALQELNNKLAKQENDLMIKYMRIAQAAKQQDELKAAAAKTAETSTPKPTTSTNTTGTVNTAGQPVTASGNPPAIESYGGILKVKEIINEEKFDTNNADSELVQDLKNYMDAENVPYIEDEDETSLEFDEDEIDTEWKDELEEIGLEPIDDEVETDDIIDITDDDEDLISKNEEPIQTGEDEDITDTHEEIDEEKVFYVKIQDEEGDFTGKIYKLFNEGDWRAKVVEGNSETFEKLNYDPAFDEFDIVAFLRENYDDADLIDKSEFNNNVEEPEKTPEIEEGHHVQTYEEFLNETR